ncbi:MAG: hypothetical protein APF76_07670 [Desulfitibacter sp. BRH_c19]|nr:MAG: hypothetical protein APF76_07670 [Desulfitibacter sp. BRH_c19]
MIVISISSWRKKLIILACIILLVAAFSIGLNYYKNMNAGVEFEEMFEDAIGSETEMIEGVTEDGEGTQDEGVKDEEPTDPAKSTEPTETTEPTEPTEPTEATPGEQTEAVVDNDNGEEAGQNEEDIDEAPQNSELEEEFEEKELKKGFWEKILEKFRKE